jgi:hypothetical protein
MELKFTPRTINELEVETKRPITDLIGEYSMKNIVLLVKKGLKSNEDEAFTAIEKYLDGGGDMVELYLKILETLQSDGFLPKALDIQTLREQMEQKLKV